MYYDSECCVAVLFKEADKICKLGYVSKVTACDPHDVTETCCKQATCHRFLSYV